VVSVENVPGGDPNQPSGVDGAGHDHHMGATGYEATGDGDDLVGWEDDRSDRPGEIDQGDHDDGEAGVGSPDRFTRIRRSTAGMMMTGIAIGLQEALELPKKEPAFVIKASSDPEGPQGPIDLHFDPDDPTKTVAIIRSQSIDGQRDDH